ncbi:hypothetical protein BDV98DRAFT_583269 [Pterulicium gracile]|uniref:Uncharacterized protein n=1 Tax=Pterulicium gracile TaxID=1884261 RepID=A0A5C3QGI1_9AGAR|nr:hypothetical protein BDV98DRAFT_583269 [Pterula gracilis]
MPLAFGSFGRAKAPKIVSEQWTQNDLAAHDIIVRPVKPSQFFGHEPLTANLNHLDPALFDTPLVSLLELCDKLNEQTYDVLTYLTWASQAVAGEETALTDFMGEALRVCGYVERGWSLKIQEKLGFSASRNGFVVPDLQIVSVNTSIISLVLKAVVANSTTDGESQLVECAIAAFHENNRTRARLGLHELEDMEMPGILMQGTQLTFYLVPVSKTLAAGAPLPPLALKSGKSSLSSKGPAKRLAVTKCTPPTLPGGRPPSSSSSASSINVAALGNSAGMEDLRARRVYLAYLVAFQGLAEGSCRALRAGTGD